MSSQSEQSQQTDLRPSHLAVYVVMWAMWVLLWSPVVIAALSATGLQGVFTDLSPLKSSSSLTEAGLLFTVGVAAISATLIIWAKYNQLRFGKRYRRQATDVPSNQQVSEFFNVNVDTLDAVKQQQIITLHFDGTVMRTELQPAMIEALETETDSYMVADLQVSALVVQVRPGGEKRYFCRLSEYDWRPLPSTDELSLDDARDLVRQMMNKRYQGVSEKIREERDLTLARFIDRHYRDANASILHTDEFQRDNDALSQLDENINSHSEVFTFLMDLKLTDITESDIRAWQTAQLDAGIDRNEVIYRTEQLRRIFTRAVQWGVVAESPLSAIDMGNWLSPEPTITNVA